MKCPLCHAPSSGEPITAHGRRYHDCPTCGLIHLAPADWLAPADELAHYRLHQNDPDDPRYRAFLDRLAAPLREVLPPNAIGLDYGCGPGPTLSVMLGERGHATTDYDPFFVPDTGALRKQYDFITCSETAEHFHDPLGEFTRLFGMLRPRGVLGVMTEMVRDTQSLVAWRYARDPTHVCFYRPHTMQWIAARFHRRLQLPEPNVALFLPEDG